MKIDIEKVIQIAKGSGEILKKHFRKQISYSIKTSKSDFVTQVDLESQNFIKKELFYYYPDIPLIGEEQKTHSFSKEKFFLVDPLDGTLNYLHGIPFFCVSIAYVEKNEPLVGVVYNPISEELFYASQGEGSFFNGTKLNSPSSLATLENSIVATGWPYDKSKIPWTINTMKHFINKVQEIRTMGSAALQMCYVTASILDLYWEIGLEPWDIAAGSVIVKESGLILRNIPDKEFNLLEANIYVCNENIYKDIKNFFS